MGTEFLFGQMTEFWRDMAGVCTPDLCAQKGSPENCVSSHRPVSERRILDGPSC